jgi:pimeloyl-ACP methyl ester carboxylesterase
MKSLILLLLPLAFAAAAVQDDLDTQALLQFILAAKDNAAKANTTTTPKPKPTSGDPEIYLGPAEIVEYWGYPVERHDVVTDDGYQLNVIRIPYGRYADNSSIPAKRPVVFLQHGLDGSAADWVTNLPNQAAAFILADAGYDVYMGNFRGNKYSRLHKTLKPAEHSFWQFSWDEMAQHDLPAMINFALKTSKADQLYYVGFSLGTTTAFAKFSQDKELAKKIRKFYALAPMANVGNIKGPLRWMAPLTGAMETIAKFVGMDEFAPNQWLMDMTAKYFCGMPVSKELCKSALFLIGGPDSTQLNVTRIPVYLSHSPGGTSTRTMVHMGQMVNSGKFQAFDYGSKAENTKHYGQPKPTEYDITKMDTPVAIYSGGQDWLSNPTDVQNLLPKLRNVVDNVYLPDYNDFDFIWGLRAAPEIYWKIRKDIKADFTAPQ